VALILAFARPARARLKESPSVSWLFDRWSSSPVQLLPKSTNLKSSVRPACKRLTGNLNYSFEYITYLILKCYWWSQKYDCSVSV
jgi:hypothetical protein